MLRETKRSQSVSIRVQTMNTKIQKEPNTKLSLQSKHNTQTLTSINIYTSPPDLCGTKSEQQPKAALCNNNAEKSLTVR